MDGAHVITGAGGVFGGASNYWFDASRNPGGVAYEFTRDAAGWQPTVLTPPANSYPHSALLAVSKENFGTTMWGAAQTNNLLYHEKIYLRTGSGALEFHPVNPERPNSRTQKFLQTILCSPAKSLTLLGHLMILHMQSFRLKHPAPASCWHTKISAIYGLVIQPSRLDILYTNTSTQAGMLNLDLSVSKTMAPFTAVRMSMKALN